MKGSQSHQDNKRLVITLHGIRTFAPWQKHLADELGRAGFNTKSLQYGYFGGLKLIRPSTRRKQIEWFRDRYTDITSEYPGAVPSIIAHSFGSYIVTRALEVFDGVKFDQVILCGSIVPRDYDWQQLFDSGQVKRVLNECAKRDIVVKAAPFFVKDAGLSGVRGFNKMDDKHLCQRFVSKFGHSDYLHILNFRENWIPFLNGGIAPRNRPPLNNQVNWKFCITILIFLLLLAGLIFGVFKIVRRLSEPHSWGSTNQVIEQSSPTVPPIFIYLRGIVKDSRGNPIPGASVKIEEFPDLLVKTTSNGDFYLDKIPAKDGTRVRVYVSASGYVDYNEFTALPGPLSITLKRR